MKNKMTMLWMAVLALFSVTHAQAQQGDLSVTSLTVTRINANAVTISYNVQNVGTANVDLKALSFQTFVSMDNVFNSNSDPAAGGAIFGSSAPVLSPGQIYGGSWVANSPVNVTQYPFIVFDVRTRTGFPNQETNFANNRRIRDIRPSRPDLAVTSIAVTNVNGNSVTYAYTIKNVGTTPLHIRKFYFQAYVSANNVLDAADVPAGGASLGSAPSELLPNATYTGTWTSSPAASLQSFPYLLFEVNLNAGQLEHQLSTSNDRFVKLLTSDFSDLVIRNIDVSHVNANSVTYRYTVRNEGLSTLYLDRFQFQTYVSYDNVFNSWDHPAGAALFSTTPLPLAPGATYTGTWTSNAPSTVSLNQYMFLIFDVKLQSGKVNPQRSTTNDQYVQNLTPYFSDLEITDITINEANDDYIDFTYTLKNIGVSSVYLERYAYVNIQSLDAIFDHTDSYSELIPFTTTPVELSTGQTYSGTVRAPLSFPITTRPHFIFYAGMLPGQRNPEQLLSNNLLTKYMFATEPDLSISQVRLDSVVNNNVDLSFTVTNTGTSQMHLEQNYFQVYLSQNNTLEIIQDIQVANGPFTQSGQMLLAAGQSRTFHAHFTSPVNLDVYQHAIVSLRVLPGQTQPDIDLSNNTRAGYLPDRFPDLLIRDILFRSFSDNQITYDAYVGNDGLTLVHLNNYRLRAYFSADPVFDASDVLADDTAFYYPVIHPLSVIAERSTTRNTTIPAGTNFLVVAVEPVTATNYEKQYNNNTYILPLPFIFPNAAGAEASYKVAREEDELTIEHVSEKELPTSYVLYTMTGELIGEGSFEKRGQINTAGFPAGIYLIRLSDGSTVETVKFVVQK